jgi:hypothetical protein
MFLVGKHFVECTVVGIYSSSFDGSFQSEGTLVEADSRPAMGLSFPEAETPMNLIITGNSTFRFLLM